MASIILGGLLFVIGILVLITMGYINWAGERCARRLEEHQKKLSQMQVAIPVAANPDLGSVIESIVGLNSSILESVKVVTYIACGLSIAAGIIFMAIGAVFLVATPF